MKLFNMKFNKVLIRTFLMFCIAISTSGCSNRLKERLGFIEHGPDEFTVVSYPDLTVLDSFELPKPKPVMHEAKYINYHSNQNHGVTTFDKKQENLDENDQIFLQQFN